MTFNELENYLTELPDQILSDTSHIVAETATEVFKDSFRQKSFDGNPWAEPKKQKSTGSLLVESGALVNSIAPIYIGSDKVVISAGNEKVPYAKVHNEGYSGEVTIQEHTRYTRFGSTQVKSHIRNVSIIQRQFMGKSSEAAQKIYARIKAYLNTI